MAFCTSCGAAMDPNAKFCTGCGATNPAAAAPTATTTAPAATPAPAAGSGNVFKVVLIILAIVFGIAIISIIAIGYVGYRAVKDVKVEEQGGTTKIETPFGTMEASKDGSLEVAKKMGIEVYPGAQPIEGNAVINVGGKKMSAANFETEDDAAKVFEFYKELYPDARMVSQTDEEYHIMTGSDDEAINIHIRPEGGKTQIAITKWESGG